MESTIGGKSRLVKTIDTLIAVIAAALGIYHFLAARLTIVSSYRHIMIHFLGCFLILFLTTLRIPAANTKSKFKNILCVICAVAILADTIFIYAHHDQYLEAMGNYTTGQIVSGAIYLLVFLIATYMDWSKVIPIMVVVELA